MNVLKLLRQGRLIPISKTGDDGKDWIVGFERKANSRKAGRQTWLKQPIPAEHLNEIVGGKR